MMLRFSKCLLTIAASSCMALPSFASEPAQPQLPASCKPPEYPRNAQKSASSGISKIGFLVRPDGTVVRWVLLNSSGSADLDNAARAALSQCVFERDEGSTGELWREVVYVWSLTDDPGLLEAKKAAALSAKGGNLNARYHLSLLLSAGAKSDAEREQALLVLRSAAELGHAQAQFDLGRCYERGKGLQANLDEALRWYRKSADQGDPLAIQRLELGRLMN
jgi:TonB family protein